MMNTGPAPKFVHELLCSTSARRAGGIGEKSVRGIELLRVKDILLQRRRVHQQLTSESPSTETYAHRHAHAPVTHTHSAARSADTVSRGESRLTCGCWRESCARL